MNTTRKSNARFSPIFTTVSLLALAAILLSACSFGGVSFLPGSVAVSITLTEDMLNRNLTSHGVSRLDGDCTIHLTEVELHDGYIRYFGYRDRWFAPDIPGSFDMSLSSQNGALKAEITAVDMPGLSLESRCVEQTNKEMVQAFTNMIEDSQGSLYFEEVSVDENALQIKVKVNLD